jgi:hypothetical protein
MKRCRTFGSDSLVRQTCCALYLRGERPNSESKWNIHAGSHGKGTPMRKRSQRCSDCHYGSFLLDRSLHHQWSSMIEISFAEINGMHKEIIEQSRQTCVCALINRMRYLCSSPMSNSVHEIHCTAFLSLGIDFYEG